MKKLMISLTLLLVVATLSMSLMGCTKIEPEAGFDDLKSAYNNTKDNFNDIYQYSEKVYNKAVLGTDGDIRNRIVNVNCAVDKHYNLIKDKNYAISIHEDKYTESIDASSKLTTKMVARNDVIVGESKNSKGDIENAVFVDSFAVVDGENVQHKKADNDITAKDFYSGEYFTNLQLMNQQVMVELGALTLEDVSFDIKDGGIVRKGQTTDYKFIVKDSYLEAYESAHGKPSVFAGEKVWLQTSYNRISNIYVYRSENLGGGLTAEYESYQFMITYLGKRVDVPNYPSDGGNNATYEIADIYDGNNFEAGLLANIA